jgi:hypothetical protein
VDGARGQRVLSRRQIVQGAGAAGLGLLAGCGRWPGQAQAPKVPTLGYLAPSFGESPDSLQAATVEELDAFR